MTKGHAEHWTAREERQGAPMTEAKFTDNGARKALWVSAKAHDYISILAKEQNKTQSIIVDELVAYCTSHSSAKSDAVLDEFEKWLTNECTYRRGSLYDALEVLRELRSQQKER